MPFSTYRAADRGDEMARCVPDDHDRLCVPMGGHPAEGKLAAAESVRKSTDETGRGHDPVHDPADHLRAVTLFILSLTIFTVIRLTGDPVTLLAEPGARAEDLDRIRAEWGLDRSWPVQYLAFAKNVFTGDLGKSFNYQMPVSTLYFQRSAQFAGTGARGDADFVRYRHPGGTDFGRQGQQRLGQCRQGNRDVRAWRCPGSGWGW